MAGRLQKRKRRREEVYNGVDRSNPATPTTAGPADRRGVQAEEVVLLNQRRDDGDADSRPNSRFSFE